MQSMAKTIWKKIGTCKLEYNWDIPRGATKSVVGAESGGIREFHEKEEEEEEEGSLKQNLKRGLVVLSS